MSPEQAAIVAKIAVQRTRGQGEMTEECRRVVYSAWARSWGLKQSSRSNIHRLIGQRPYYGHGPGHVDVPGHDHGTAWNRLGKPAAFVGQPYDHFERDQDAARRFAEAYDLDLTMFAPDDPANPAWHFPGRVWFILYTRRGLRPEIT